LEQWNIGMLGGRNMTERKNINRGYMKLIVWQDARAYYVLTCTIFRAFSYELKRGASQQIASVDSIHRNIAEGYCRRSIREYLQFLNIALSSAGESVSGLHVYHTAGQLTAAQFEELDALAYKLESGLKRLIESLQEKQQTGTWQDSFIIRESNVVYGSVDEKPEFNSSSTHHSSIPPFQYPKRNRRQRK
jgi:four helix bundle protein